MLASSHLRLFGSWGVDFVKNDGCVDPECAEPS